MKKFEQLSLFDVSNYEIKKVRKWRVIKVEVTNFRTGSHFVQKLSFAKGKSPWQRAIEYRDTSLGRDFYIERVWVEDKE